MGIFKYTDLAENKTQYQMSLRTEPFMSYLLHYCWAAIPGMIWQRFLELARAIML